MENSSTQTATGPSLKDCDSEQENLVPLMRIQLAKLNRLEGEVPDAQIPVLYRQWQHERDRSIELAKERREAETKKSAQDAVLEGMRKAIRRDGGNPDGLNEAQLRQAVARLNASASERQRERERLGREDLRHRQARNLFAKSKCPFRHVENMPAIEEPAQPQWVNLRDLLARQAGYANGFLVALLGGRGVGKTQLAVSVVEKCCDRLMSCRYVKAIDLFRDFRRAYTPVGRGQAGESEDDIIAAWVKYDLLVIDECHQRGDTKWEDNTLINLLDLRYDASCCTILIANQTKDDFAAAMGDSIVSRIHETGEAFVCDWPSYRKRGEWMQRDDAPKRVPTGVEQYRATRQEI